jgi:hypothetical protein
VGRRIDTHGARAPWSVHGLDDLKFPRRRLPGNGQGTVTATGKSGTVEPRGVDASTNREIGKDLAIIRAHDDQLLRLSTTDEQAASREIHGHADRGATGGSGPFVNDLHRLGVHNGNLIFVHEVDLRFPLPIGGKKLRLVPKLNRRVRFTRRRVQVRLDGNQ